MKQKKKLLSLVLVLVLVVTTMMIPANMAYASGITSGTDGAFTWNYDVETKTLKIDGDGLLSGGKWKEYKSEVEKIELTGNITEIGAYTFANNSKLTSISIPDSVTTIAYGAFDHCSALPSVKLPKSLKKIEDCAFVFCTALSDVQVSDGLENMALNSIGYKAFGGCKNLKKLTIPNSAYNIGAYAFGYDIDDGGKYTPHKIKGTEITGINGSQAQFYAQENQISFKGVKDSSYGISVKAAGKKKNGLTAPKIEVRIETNPFHGDSFRVQALEIKKVKGAAGYKVYTSFTGKANSWSSFKTKDLYHSFSWDEGKNKTCYYKVRAYKKVGGKTIYGPYSETIKIK